MGSKDAMRKMAEEQAMARKGYKFIPLQLIDYNKGRIQGAHKLRIQRYRDENGLPKFEFEEIGGPLNFEFDEFTGTMTCRMLDCEKNRDFLASMISYNYWEIQDENIKREITTQSKGITKRAIREMPPQDELSDEELEAKAKALTEELARRKGKAPEVTAMEPDIGKPKPPAKKAPAKKRTRKSMVAVED